VLRTIPLAEDLLEATWEAMSEETVATPRDFSPVVLVFPSKRMIFFMREVLGRHVESALVPPTMYTMDQFVDRLFARRHPGIQPIGEMAAAAVVYGAVREAFGGTVYAGGSIPATFPPFYLWARTLFHTLETLLIEGGQMQKVSKRLYEAFAQLGDYHAEYKRFIASLPDLVACFRRRLLESGRRTRGLTYRMVAEAAESGSLGLPAGDIYVFSGINALNHCEAAVLGWIFQNRTARLVIRTDTAALSNPGSPFALQANALETLGLTPGERYAEPACWNCFLNKVRLYALPNVETEMVQATALLEEILARGDRSPDLKRIAVLLPDSSSLIPFIHGVVSRISVNGRRVPFNITLGYPFVRTPLFQLIQYALDLNGEMVSGTVSAARYLDLIRHPYVKMTASGTEENPLRRGIQLIEEAIVGRNLVRFRPEELTGILEEILLEKEIESGEAGPIRAEMERIHAVFLPRGLHSLPSLVDFLKAALREIRHWCGAFLFLEEYVAEASRILEEIGDFSRDAGASEFVEDPEALSTLVSAYFSEASIAFEGSPLRGIQVMGMLESRGLSFDEVIILDVEEGILPQHLKYDPLLPQDIRSAFGVRGHREWDTLFSFNFFSLVAASQRVHILWTEHRAGMEKTERSRFVERIVYESQRLEGREIPVLARNTRCSVRLSGSRPVVKTQWMRDRIASMVLSVSSLETYLHCPLRFYYGHLLGLQEREGLAADPDAGVLGTIIHRLLERFYREGVGREMPPATALRGHMDGLLTEEMTRRGFGVDQGIARIRHWVIREKMLDFIEYDLTRLERTGVKITDLERKIRTDFTLDEGRVTLSIGGRLDRVEQVAGRRTLVDYKTGASFAVAFKKPPSPLPIENLFSRPEAEYLECLTSLRRAHRNFQMLLYMELACREWGIPRVDINGAYAFLREPERFFCPVFTDGLPPRDRAQIMDRFSGYLHEILLDLWRRPAFVGHPGDVQFCGTCPFARLCGA